MQLLLNLNQGFFLLLLKCLWSLRLLAIRWISQDVLSLALHQVVLLVQEPLLLDGLEDAVPSSLDLHLAVDDICKVHIRHTIVFQVVEEAVHLGTGFDLLLRCSSLVLIISFLAQILLKSFNLYIDLTLLLVDPLDCPAPF